MDLYRIASRWGSLAGVGVICWASCIVSVAQSSPAPPSNSVETIILPDPLPDPIEPVNRIMWELNVGIMSGIIKPTARAYRAVVRRPVRVGISNFGRNINYPARLINNLLQARWEGARDETYRFGCNTVLGVAGFIDVASRFGIPKSDADFGQTFGKWGWRPHAFVMLPFYGPSSERDTLGLAADTAANPLNYFSPYAAVPQNPLTYLGPYTYASYVVTYNNLSDVVDKDVRLIHSQMDPYSGVQLEWAFLRDKQHPVLPPSDPPDPAALQTLGAVFFEPDQEFPRHAREDAAWLPTTGQKLPFTYWLQRGAAPLVYIVPGIGSHRLSSGALALAELIYTNGFSVVCVSNPFNYEFMRRASTAYVPGFTPIDAGDLHVALSQIDQFLTRHHPGRISRRALVGYSMGGFETLFVDIQAPGAPSLLHFDRYVAIDAPVRLLHGVDVLDRFYQAPLSWPEAERTPRMENALIKVTTLASGEVPITEPPPFSGLEAKFLIGANFRLILRDVIYESQLRHNQGVLEHPVAHLRREPVYREILRYSFDDYVQRFVVPAYRERQLDLSQGNTFAEGGDLRAHGAALQADPSVRLIVNRNDPLLEASDLDWLQSNFGADRLTVFDHGGHLGNLGEPQAQHAILKALDGLR